MNTGGRDRRRIVFFKQMRRQSPIREKQQIKIALHKAVPADEPRLQASFDAGSAVMNRHLPDKTKVRSVSFFHFGSLNEEPVIDAT